MIIKLQIIIENIAASVLSLVRIIFLSKFNLKLKLAQGIQECVVLVNGPSLNQSLIEDIEFIKNEKRFIFVVNSFVFSDYYEKLRPKFYVLNAPEFWIENVTELHQNLRSKIFSGILKKTNWDMIILVPAEAKKSQVWKNLFSENANISVTYYNKTPVEGITWLKHFLFSINLGMPRPHNVLIPTIFLAINMGFKNIYIFGADHTWHEQIKTDRNNVITVNHQHFHDKEKHQFPMYQLDGREFHIHEVFRKLYLAFKGYFELNEYAKTKRVQIYNASKISYIDAFEKIEVKSGKN